MPFPFNTPATQFAQAVTLRDAKGNTSTFRFFFDGTGAAHTEAVQTDVQTVITAMAALSNAAVQSARGLVGEWGVAQYGAHAANGAYESIIEKAVLVFQDASGQLHRFQIPAPKIAIFKADKVTVDPANGLVTTFITAMTTAGASGTRGVITRQSETFANYMGGVYRSAKLRRRLNILVLEPDLTPSLPAE